MHAQGQTLHLGTRQYQLLRLLGRSTYGEVWAAQGGVWNHRVALKFVRTDMMALAPAQERERWTEQGLAKEVAFLQQLRRDDRRHLVRLTDSGLWNGHPVLAMELMDCNLRQHLELERMQGRCPAPQQVLNWLSQLNHALRVIHAHGMSYLDLKPENILLCDQGQRIRLSDFGGLQRLDAQDGHPYWGTPGWQAPEQCMPNQMTPTGYRYRTDHRTDYFALGLLLFTIVCGGMQLQFAQDSRNLRATSGETALFGIREVEQVTLQGRERQQFLQCLGALPETDATWQPAGPSNSGVAKEAWAAMLLDLLHKLLASRPADRPNTASEISLRLQAIQLALRKQQRETVGVSSHCSGTGALRRAFSLW